jgi:ribonucleoside-diphosphate reductase beta chain
MIFGNFIKLSENLFWTAEEINLAQDLTDWNEKLNEDERHYIKMVLAFSSIRWYSKSKSGIRTLLMKFNIQKLCFIMVFKYMMENIHSETYSLLIDTYIKDESERTKLFNAIDIFLLL